MNVNALMVWLGATFLGCVVVGCGDPAPREVKETSEMSFEDAARRIEQESLMSEDSE
ncbi:hypothetical protein Poly51_17010 [Rubripirellula tenax]|uniref:Uncharacterized protein n=1 Tax=Rubripirellula tenax TaxID=2528015 RepID=A0A5C6FH60_9BACT|nr:hypothetical protein [Rubripirellula tenax]TWU58921.1 hypothetical protein Poly51_17010 [Rubripirellula tenax]